MKTFQNPEHFAFTNNFNKSLLYSRITMMNRQSSWRSWWRYGAVGMVLFFTVMCQKISKESKEVIPVEDGSVKIGNTPYLVSKNGKLYGVITPNTIDKDIQEIGTQLAKYQVPFHLFGVQRDEKGRIVQIKDVVLGEYGSEAMKVVKRRSNFGTLKKAFFDFCYDPEFGCYPNIHPDEFPSSLSKTLLQEGVVSYGSSQSIKKWLSNRSSLTQRRGKVTLTPESEMESTWTGSMNQLLEASFFKRKQAMLYVRPDHHLDLYDEYKKSVTVFVDRKEVTLEELKTVHIRQVAIVYAHERSKAQTMPGLSNHQANDTDYIVWIDRAPNRMKRDSTIHIVSPFYTGDF
jgi:ribosomal protein L9